MAESLAEPTILILRVETTNPDAAGKMHDLAMYLNDQVGIDVDSDGRFHDASIELMHDDLLWYGSEFDGTENNEGAATDLQRHYDAHETGSASLQDCPPACEYKPTA